MVLKLQIWQNYFFKKVIDCSKYVLQDSLMLQLQVGYEDFDIWFLTEIGQS